MSVTLLRGSATEVATLAAPSGPGNPGWSATGRAGNRYAYRNGSAPAGPSPIRAIRLREGKGLRIVAEAVGLALATPQGSVGVRIAIGGTRICALFAGDAHDVHRTLQR